MILDLDTVKKHLNIESGYTEDDQYLVNLIGVAEKAVEKHCNRTFQEIAEKEGGNDVPAPLKQAMLLMIGNLYANREPVGTKVQEIPLNYEYLINLFVNYC